MAASGNVTCEWVDIGDGLRAYYGKPAGEGPFPAVVIYIEAFGVNDHFEKLTARFAEAGFVAITPDIYDSKIYAYDDLDNAIGHLKRMDDDTVIAQTAATVDFLEKRSEVKSGDICVTGFCMGSRRRQAFTAVESARLKTSRGARFCWTVSVKCRRRSCCGMGAKTSRSRRKSMGALRKQ
jgi:carboxymethylenebutenolidase